MTKDSLGVIKKYNYVLSGGKTTTTVGLALHYATVVFHKIKPVHDGLPRQKKKKKSKFFWEFVSLFMSMYLGLAWSRCRDKLEGGMMCSILRTTRSAESRNQSQKHSVGDA